MAFMSTIDIIGSGITAQHLRLDVISENVTNINTTRTEQGGAYRRKVTVFQAVDGRDRFRGPGTGLSATPAIRAPAA